MTVKDQIKNWVENQPLGTQFTIPHLWEYGLKGSTTKQYILRVIKQFEKEGLITCTKNPNKGRGQPDKYEVKGGGDYQVMKGQWPVSSTAPNLQKKSVIGAYPEK